MLEERGFGDDYGRRNRSLLQVCDNMGGRGVFSFWNKFGRHGRSLARKDGYSYDSHEVKHVSGNAVVDCVHGIDNIFIYRI